MLKVKHDLGESFGKNKKMFKLKNNNEKKQKKLPHSRRIKGKREWEEEKT